MVSDTLNYDRASKYCTKGESFYTVRELYGGPQRIEYIDEGTGEIKSSSSYDFIRMAYNYETEGCLAIKDNSLYLIESPLKPARLIRSVDEGQDITFFLGSSKYKEVPVKIHSYEYHFASIYTGTDVILVDFNGNVFGENIKEVHDVLSNAFSANPHRLVLFTTNDNTTWLYDIDTKTKTEFKFKLYQGGCNAMDNFIIEHDFTLSACATLEKQSEKIEDYLLENELFYADSYVDFKIDAINNVCSMIDNVEEIRDIKIFVERKDDKVTFYTLEQGEFKPICVEGDKVLYFDAFVLNPNESINDKIVFDCVSGNYDKESKNIYHGETAFNPEKYTDIYSIDVNNLIDNIHTHKILEISKDSIIFTDGYLNHFVDTYKTSLENAKEMVIEHCEFYDDISNLY